MTTEQMKLHQKLWNIADELRGNMNADEFKNYILGFIFFKFLSEKIQLQMDKMLKNDNLTFVEAFTKSDEFKNALKAESVRRLGYFLEPRYLFDHFVQRAKRKEFFLEDLQAALKKIEDSTQGQESEEDFMGLFEDVDLQSTKLGKTVEDKNDLIGRIFSHLSQVDFQLDNADIDILGDAYEYLIGQFASGAGKKAGEFYTPQMVSKILARIVSLGKDRIKNAYDPTCGSGSLLLRIQKEARVAHFYGQELNRTTYNLARMNMILHDVRFDKFSIEQGDTLERPMHLDMQFEAVVANPPFSANWSASEQFLSDERFAQYGRLAPRTKADFAFLTHMLHQLDEKGTMAIVLPHGVLFRVAAEGVIRRYMIENKNYLDTVIGLPANIFYGTGIPTVILVFKKCREESENILFIDASQGFEKAKNQNRLREEDLDKIILTYRDRKEIEKYSHLATMEEIKENDYNLNIPRYVDTFEEEEPVDLEAVVSELEKLESEIKEVDQRIIEQCKELRIKPPIIKDH